MAEYTQLSFPFTSTSGKKVIADFSGEQVTSDAGVLLLRVSLSPRVRYFLTGNCWMSPFILSQNFYGSPHFPFSLP